MKLEQTAIHEAGHVVVAYLLGLACNGVALTHDEVEETHEYGYATSPNPLYGYEYVSGRERQSILHDASNRNTSGSAGGYLLCKI